jgi:carboxymethylenebutenolidase
MMQIDTRVFDLYDEYCHGRIERREFLKRASAVTVAGASGLAMAQALLPRYA